MIDLFHSESFWVSVAFFIFIALSFKKGKRLLLTSLDSRIENIVKNINDAKKIRSDAENNLKEVEKNLNQLKTIKKITQKSRIKCSLNSTQSDIGV